MKSRDVTLLVSRIVSRSGGRRLEIYGLRATIAGRSFVDPRIVSLRSIRIARSNGRGSERTPRYRMTFVPARRYGSNRRVRSHKLSLLCIEWLARLVETPILS